MTEYQHFGDPARFEVAVRFAPDDEARIRLPEHGGWSMGELCLTVGEHCVTQHRLNDENRPAIRWYLLPVFEWLADNWSHLLHEERFAWRENSAAPAASATFYALRSLMTAVDDEQAVKCDGIQQWRARHALRAADPSSLLPDVYFRRLGNDVEVSWTARQPAFAPDGFRLELPPGVATMSVEDVAAPLWQALNWFCENAPQNLDDDDRHSLYRLRSSIDFNRDRTAADFENDYLPKSIIAKIKKTNLQFSYDQTVLMPGVPVASRFSDHVLMYGGVSPNIGQSDFDALSRFLHESMSHAESASLAAIVDTSVGGPGQTPYEEGYSLAEDVLDALGVDRKTDFIDIREILQKLDIHTEPHGLKTDSIRGVAIAGKNYRPSILVNKTSNYNRNEEGRRFTLAHEFCHVLFDRSRAKRIAHTSGAWAQPGVEKRANAFAAMLLMPRHLICRHINIGDPNIKNVEQAASVMHVGVSALIEHLYNMNMIDEWLRDTLRSQATPPRKH